MPKVLRRFLAAFIVLGCVLKVANAQEINLLPKYGSGPKNEAQQAADSRFIASIDNYYKGDRKKAAEVAAARGWEFYRQGDRDTAMRRFNQAWLLDSTNGKALWGMAVIQGDTGKYTEALKLFSEAESAIGDNVDFAADYARTIGMTGVQTRNVALVQDALKRFSRVYTKDPQHTLNLQNWAITLYWIGHYQEAWKKIELAEATPRATEIDEKFVEALKSKMPHP